jgi:hypothetical protein
MGRAQKTFSIKETILRALLASGQAASRWVGLPPAGRQLVSVPFKICSSEVV